MLCIVDESCDDDDEPVWLISTGLDCSVRSENCEVLHLNSNMVAASLKQSGLVTDRAYSHLTASANEHLLTINALTFLLLLVERCSNSYNLFIEAAQALCNRAMKPGKTITVGSRATKTDRITTQSRGRHVSNKPEQNNRSGKTAKQQEQTISAEDDVDNSEKPDFANEDKENDSSSQQGLKNVSFLSLHISVCLTFLALFCVAL